MTVAAAVIMIGVAAAFLPLALLAFVLASSFLFSRLSASDGRFPESGLVETQSGGFWRNVVVVFDTCLA